MELKHYAFLANLFDYPDENFLVRVKEVRDFIIGHYPQVADEIRAFADHMATLDLNTTGELYTRSFDVQSATTLDLGYVLFGDDYKRGELLVNLNREHKNAHNDCGTELADHLGNVLRLLSRLQDRELIHELIEEIIAPALSHMIAEFDPERLVKKNALYKKHYTTILDTPTDKATIYRHALQVLYQVIKIDFNYEEKPKPSQTTDFLRSLKSELQIEAAGQKS